MVKTILLAARGEKGQIIYIIKYLLKKLNFDYTRTRDRKCWNIGPSVFHYLYIRNRQPCYLHALNYILANNINGDVF